MRKFGGLIVVAMMTAACIFAQEEILDATDLDALRAKVGVEATVQGIVTEIGMTKGSTITFINIGLPKKKGFVAVVFQKDYASFPDGFDQFRNQKVRVKGPLKLYRGETPQIVLTSPDQISLVTD